MHLDNGEQEMQMSCGWVIRLIDSSGQRSYISTSLPADSYPVYQDDASFLSRWLAGQVLTQVCKKSFKIKSLNK